MGYSYFVRPVRGKQCSAMGGALVGLDSRQDSSPDSAIYQMCALGQVFPLSRPHFTICKWTGLD